MSVPKLLKNKSLFQASDCHYSKYFGTVFTCFHESKTNRKKKSPSIQQKLLCVYRTMDEHKLSQYHKTFEQP